MPRPTSSSTREDGRLPLQNYSCSTTTSSADNERPQYYAHSKKKRIQRILQRGQIFLCLSFALMTFALNMIIFARVMNSKSNDDDDNNISADNSIITYSDAPILTGEVARRNKLKVMRRTRQRERRGISKTVLYNTTRYQHIIDGYSSIDKSSPQEPPRLVNVGKQQRRNDLSYHPKVACFQPNGCEDYISEGIDLHPSLIGYSEDSIHSIPIIRSRRNKIHRDDDDDDDNDDNNDTDTFAKQNNNAVATSSSSCRQSRSIKSRTAIHPTCNDIHSIGFDDQMFDRDDDSTRGEFIDLLAVGGANSVWKTTSIHNGENAILKTAKYLKQFDKDRLDLYLLDAMVAAMEGNPQLVSLLQSEKTAVVTSSASSTYSSSSSSISSSSWNHIMPIYSHCYTATIAPVASGTLKEYVTTTYPQEHNGERIDPLDKLRLALQVARGLYQIQMYRYGKPTFAHLDLNPSQFLMFYSQQSGGGRVGQYGSRKDDSKHIPILQINDFNRGRFLHWDNQNNTCPFQFDGCDKNTRGSRWHGPDRFIGCIDVNERIDTFALGGIFFFLLSDGEAPFYNTRQFGDHIKEGELPPVPREAADAAGDHPAYEALSEMVVRCRALRIEDRPSSLEVVRMLEEKLEKLELGSF